MWANRGIWQKVFILSFVIAILPLLVVSTAWSIFAREQLKEAATANQKVVLTSTSQRVNDFLSSKINSLITRSQEPDIINLNADPAKSSLLQYANQDSDIQRIALVDSAGNERVVVKNHELSKTLTNVKTSDAFKAVAQPGNDVLISDVTYDNGEPKIVVSVPLLSNVKLGNQDVTGAGALARGSDPKGALIVEVSLSNLWGLILTTHIGDAGYIYLVDAGGKLIAHPEQSLLTTHPDMSHVSEVASFLAQPDMIPQPATTLSEKQVTVLSAHRHIQHSGWAVVTEEPEASLFAPVQHIYRVIMWLFIAACLLVIVLGVFFSRNLTRPIKSLVSGALELGQGNLDAHIAVRSKDEIGVLAQRFNAMADSVKQLVSNLRLEDAKLSVVLDSVGEGIVAVDAENKIVFANISAAVLAGALPSDLAGSSFGAVFALTKNNQPFQLDPNSTKVYKEVVFISPNRRLHYLDIFANRIEDDSGSIKSIITLRDQTDERDLEMMKLDFVSMAAHELRTPITAIRGYLGLLSNEQTELSSSSKQSIERAQSSASQLVGLINNLLNVSKIEGGSMHMSYTKVDWVKVVQDSVTDHRFSADEKNIKLHFTKPDKHISLVADEIAIKEVINNLISNAIHYTEEGGHVTVGIKLDGKRVFTSVQDDGIGMAPNVLPRLFTKFYRAKGGLASGSGGTGLGLYIAKSIVELHKGKIWVESEEGQGSTFTFSLPVFDEVQYKELANKQTAGVHKHRGWITKDITR
jgi:NtrC-family two-component system sensor histidine kinase KinB